MQARTHISTVVFCALAIFVSGCCTTGGTSADSIPTVEPRGEYQFSFVDRGESVTGKAIIDGAPGQYTGTVHFDDGRPETKVSSAAASGNLMLITADIPGAVLLLRLRFDGDAFAGDWVMGRAVGTITGTRSEMDR